MSDNSITLTSETALFNGSFADLSIPPQLHLGIKDLGYSHPTHVQHAVFEKALTGQDLAVIAKTGSGKTTAYCLPLLAKFSQSSGRPQALVLTPTRELARQVAMECTKLSHHQGIKVESFYGGLSIGAQIAALASGVDIVIGTPGRIKDLIDRKHLRMDHITSFVLDEADEMLSLGFWPDVMDIISTLPTHQTLLFSATLPDDIRNLAQSILRDPLYIEVVSQEKLPDIRHIIHTENDNIPKPRNLLNVLEFYRPSRAIVFCNRKEETDLIEKYLKRFGFNTMALHGDISQTEREKIIDKVTEGSINLVIATDLAARGIDIPKLDFVFNYDLPESNEVYIHRTGRTGRMGKSGTAVNLVNNADFSKIDQLKAQYNVVFDNIPVPTEEEVLALQAHRIAENLAEAADGVEFAQYQPIAQALLNRPDIQEILAFILRNTFLDKSPQKIHHSEHHTHHGKPEYKKRRPQQDSRKHNRQLDDEAPQQQSSRHEKPIVPAVPRHHEREREREHDHHHDREQQDAVQLYVNLGNRDGFKEITALAQHLCELSQTDLGHFTGMGNLRDRSSHIEVDFEVADQIIAQAHGKPKQHGKHLSETIICEIGSSAREEKYPPRKPYFNKRR